MKKIKTIGVTLWNFMVEYPLTVITIISLLFVYQAYQLYGYAGGDQFSYENAAKLLMHGELDSFRTPCYPMIMALCQKLSSSGENGLLLIVQIIILSLSVVSLYCVLKHLGVAQNIAVIVSAVYALCPAFINVRVEISTETFAISFSVFLVSYFERWLRCGRLSDLVRFSFCVTFLLFLRPSFLYMLVALTVIAVIFLFRKKYLKGVQLVSIVAVSSCLMFGYCKIVESKCGVFTPSTVSIINDYFNVTKIGKFAPENISDPLIRYRMLDSDKEEKWDDVFDGSSMYGIPLKEMFDELQRVHKQDRMMYVKFFVVNLRASMYNQYDAYYRKFNINFGLVYFFLIVYGCVIVYEMIKDKNTSMVLVFLWLMCVGNIVVNLVGSYSSWTRLFLPSVPLLLIMIAVMCNRFKMSYIKA
jgi:hypothetical protein